MVATVRPSRIVESHESHRHTRSRSTRGNRDRKPHTPTYTAERNSWVSAYGVSETERAIHNQSPTLKAASAASDPSQSVSLRSMDETKEKPECKRTVTVVQQT